MKDRRNEISVGAHKNTRSAADGMGDRKSRVKDIKPTFKRTKRKYKHSVEFYFDGDGQHEYDDAEVKDGYDKAAAAKARRDLAEQRKKARDDRNKRRYNKVHDALYRVLDRPNAILAASKKTGQTRIFVKGKSSVRVLVAISKICRVEDVAIESDGVGFYIPSKVCGKIIALLDNLCYDYKIVNNKGILPFALRALARAGLSIGIALGIVLISIYPNFVTRVTVTGINGQQLDNALITKINGILESHGVAEGKWLVGLDADDLRKQLLALDGISYAGVERRGTHVDVTVAKEMDAEQFIGVKGSKVVATKLATVTRVIVEGGTAEVKYGDVVRVGDTLIDGYVLYGDDKVEVEARGTVYGKIYYSSTRFFGDSVQVERERREKRMTEFGFSGRVPKTPDDPFGDSELHISVEDFGFLLPIKVYTYTFISSDYESVPNDATDEQLTDIVYAELIATLSEPVKVPETYIKIRRADGGRYVTVTLEAEEIISQ